MPNRMVAKFLVRSVGSESRMSASWNRLHSCCTRLSIRKNDSLSSLGLSDIIQGVMDVVPSNCARISCLTCKNPVLTFLSSSTLGQAPDQSNFEITQDSDFFHLKPMCKAKVHGNQSSALKKFDLSCLASNSHVLVRSKLQVGTFFQAQYLWKA